MGLTEAQSEFTRIAFLCKYSVPFWISFSGGKLPESLGNRFTSRYILCKTFEQRQSKYGRSERK